MRKATSLSSTSLHFKTTHIFSHPNQLFSTSINTNNNPLNETSKKQQYLLQHLHSCSKFPSFTATKSLHALVITMSSFCDQPIYLNNNLISFYASLDKTVYARKVFDEMSQRNAVSYNTLIGSYCRDGDVEKGLELFSEMRGFGFIPTQFTFGTLFSCSSLDLFLGSQLQPLVFKNGLFFTDAFAGTALLGFLGRHACVDESICFFEEMPVKSLVTWNLMINLLGNHGFVEESVSMFREIVRAGASLYDSSFVGVLSGFVSEQDLKAGEHIHGLVFKMGVAYEVSVANLLINMYLKCSGLCSAEKVFEETPTRDVVSWNTIIGALVKNEKQSRTFELFMKMSVDNVYPNSTTFVSLINSCAQMQILMNGQFLHTKIIRNGYESHVFVGSALVDFYAKCDKLEEAHRCFDEIWEKNVVSWNALIWGYSNKLSSTSISVLKKMLRLGYDPNEFSFSSVLKSCFILELLQLHCLVIKMGYEQNDYVLSSLITSYAKNGQLSDALTFVTASNVPVSVVPSNAIAGIYNKTGQYHKTQELFALVKEPDFVFWNILIASCARNGDFSVVFELFKSMLMAKTYPDNYTLVSVLSVCANLCNLALGSTIHALMIKTDFKCCDTFVCNVLLDMYGKCGSVENAWKIFTEIEEKNLISWTTLISALGLHGFASEALEKFEEMEQNGFKPDGVAFIVALSACRHGGLVKQGMELFEKMKHVYGIEPSLDHYNCAVDLLARHGQLKEAENLITNMPFPPNAQIWRSFLEGCEMQRALKDQIL